MWCNVTSGKLQNLILRDLRQSRTKSPPSPTRQLHHDRSPTRPQVPSKKSPLRLQNAFDVPPPYVRSFLLLQVEDSRRVTQEALVIVDDSWMNIHDDLFI